MNCPFNYADYARSATGAFTAVTARQTLGRTIPTAQVEAPLPGSRSSLTGPSASTNKSKRDWPPSVRSYVQRAFADENMIPDISRPEMEETLKQVISRSVEEDTLTIVDWNKLPLPQAMIQEARRQRIYSQAPRPVGFSAPADLETNTTTPKKRKSSDLDSSQMTDNQAPPWYQPSSRSSFESRISYPDKRQRKETAPVSGSSKSHQILDDRKKRFENGQLGHSSTRPWRSAAIEVPEEAKGPVVGRSQDLEKRYFRLTSAPNPDTVRPLHILEKTLDYLKSKWREEKKYSYICDQFKSLRQDLTVQHIKTEFTVTTYEIHARIALEKGDLSEYNQCQTQLRALYNQNLGGHPTEFLAYRILYFLHTSNRTDMNDVLAGLTPAEKREPAVKHALDTRSALALGNYHRFFQLFLVTPNMGAYLMDMFVGRERLAALATMCRA